MTAVYVPRCVHCVEPLLQHFTGEKLSYATANGDDSARHDIRAHAFWGSQQQCTYLDVRLRSSVTLMHPPPTECVLRTARSGPTSNRSCILHIWRDGKGCYRHKRPTSPTATKCEHPYSVVLGWLPQQSPLPGQLTCTVSKCTI